MFIIDLRSPYIQIKELSGYVTHGKWSWFHSNEGTKHLIGSSAFYTLGGAYTARLGALTKVLTSTYIFHSLPHFYHACKRAKADSVSESLSKTSNETFTIKWEWHE